MSDLQKGFFDKLIIEPTKNNLSIVLFWLGLLFVFIGAIFGGSIDSWKYVPSGTGEAILKSGSAILGAGVFAVIMKSAQFTELFQKHIYDVFYSPQEVKDGVPLIEKWKSITNALLKNVLPSTHHQAVERIEKQFFNSELDYHFEEHTVSYEISIDESNIATVKSVTNSTLIISPFTKDPTLKQYIETEGKFTFKALRLNGASFYKPELFTVDPKNPNRHLLEVPLREHANKKANTDERIIRLERVVEWTQDLTNDPYIKGAIKRYIKGAKIRVKVPESHKVHFERFGLGELPDEHYITDDGHGFERWQLVTPDNLLLPGQGYILVLVPQKSGE
ncbi:hypothetical protein HR060_18935 [Catenovulum sp. SM1970]|uniref:hypothetical protein n=1 Tax=Marinifaba aquimaris TaxID=2741323 RepID=UPI001573A25D|nr:hypothetical protein [Marinifaba aquimaris]NTS78915.1 hypothetical protein [Marinifaba aquimaris]